MADFRSQGPGRSAVAEEGGVNSKLVFPARCFLEQFDRPTGGKDRLGLRLTGNDHGFSPVRRFGVAEELVEIGIRFFATQCNQGLQNRFGSHGRSPVIIENLFEGRTGGLDFPQAGQLSRHSKDGIVFAIEKRCDALGSRGVCFSELFGIEQSIEEGMLPANRFCFRCQAKKLGQMSRGSLVRHPVGDVPNRLIVFDFSLGQRGQYAVRSQPFANRGGGKKQLRQICEGIFSLFFHLVRPTVPMLPAD